MVAEVEARRNVAHSDRKESSSRQRIQAIEVPAQIYDWKAAAGRPAQQSPSRCRSAIENNSYVRFRTGLAVLGYERDATGNGKFLLGHWDEKWSYASGRLTSSAAVPAAVAGASRPRMRANALATDARDTARCRLQGLCGE